MKNIRIVSDQEDKQWERQEVKSTENIQRMTDK